MADTATRKRDPDDLLQIRVWITQAKYDQLKLRARHHDSSVAAEVRALMDAGEQRADAAEQLVRKLDSVMSYLQQHLEPLTFIAAMDAAAGREYWKNQTLFSAQKAGSDDPDRAASEADRYIEDRATKRIQRKLHQLPDDKAEDGDDDENENDGT